MRPETGWNSYEATETVTAETRETVYYAAVYYRNLGGEYFVRRIYTGDNANAADDSIYSLLFRRHKQVELHLHLLTQSALHGST